MPLIVRPRVGPSTTVLARSPLPPATLMPLLADHPLPVMFTGWGPFPAVRRVDDQEGSWDRVGKTRMLRLGDGGSVVERIVERTPGISFAYELTGFSDVFRRLVRGVRGQWTFTPDGDGSIVTWTWEFAARPGRRWIMAAVVGPLWRRYMQRMVREAVQELSRRPAGQPRRANAEA